ncbi:pentapeptide repeat-containing protein [Nonomuraea sp. B19D2]|uniref:pentapeptide repeat-containing protein n=1 Tax=Nonomuraea sp. B19D2 TaxID=3159561 RepID=UPI0032D9E81C
MPRLPLLRRAPHQGTAEPRPVELLHIGTALAVTLVAATLMAGGLLAAALAWMGLPSKLMVDTGNLLEIIKISLAVVGGIGGAVALVVAYRKQRLAEEENQRARLTARREDTKLYAERFDKAADKLGSEAPAVRLAGVHALAALADDWAGGRQMCIDVLCAYLRMPPEPEPDIGQEPARHSTWRAMREVRATTIRLIGAHLQRDAAVPWHGHDFDFTGVTFDASANFAGAVFSGGRVWFLGAVFSGDGIFFSSAVFSGAVVMFNRAVFSGSTGFVNATFSDSEISFEGAVFSAGRVSFAKAVFSNANVIFSGAVFSGSTVSFANAKFSGGWIPFDGAEFSGGDVDFTRVAEWSHPPTGLPEQATGLRLPSPPMSQPT